jgi:hypothetical protein
MKKPGDLGISPVRETVLWYILGEVWDSASVDYDAALMPGIILLWLKQQKAGVRLSNPELSYLAQTARWIAEHPGVEKFLVAHREKFACVNRDQPLISQCDAVKVLSLVGGVR